MPKSMREELAVLIGLEVLTEGVFFDIHDLRKLSFSDAQVTRVLASLQKSSVLTRVNSRKYLFTEEFLALLREELGRKTPRGGIAQFPDMGVFDVCGMADWSEDEVEQFARRLRNHWRDLSKR
jgi:hypothetical protein